MSIFGFSIKPLGVMLTLAALGIWLSACGTLPQQPVTIAELPTAAQAVQRLEDRRRFVRSFLMRGEISFEGEQGEVNGEHLIQGSYPNRLRAEIMGPFSRPVLLLVSDGAWLYVLDYKANRAFWGRASRRNLARFVGLDLSLEEIYALLTGNVPLMKNAHSVKLIRAPQAERLILELAAQGGVVGQALTFDSTRFDVVSARIGEWGGENEMQASFKDFEAASPFSYPRKISLNDSRERKIMLNCDELSINPVLAGAPFDPQPLKGVPVELLP